MQHEYRTYVVLKHVTWVQNMHLTECRGTGSELCSAGHCQEMRQENLKFGTSLVHRLNCRATCTLGAAARVSLVVNNIATDENAKVGKTMRDFMTHLANPKQCVMYTV